MVGLACHRRQTASTASVGVSPRHFNADPTGVASATDALNLCIREANENGTTIDLSNGTWRVTGLLHTITAPLIDGGGSGELLIDWAPPDGTAILDCDIAVGEAYTVTAVDVVTYDFEGAYSADSTVTRLTLSLGGGQSMPAVGAIGKLTATDALVGVEAGDQAGQHAYVAAVSGSYVYVPWLFPDAFTTSMQLVLLGRQPTMLRGIGFRGVWADIVTSDLLYDCIRVQGAITPTLERLRFRDLPGNGAMLVGTYGARTWDIHGERFRNATASESPAIPGYVMVDAGSWMSVHHGLGGHDVRHVFTTISPDADDWDRVAWGRAFRPKVIGGSASACSAAAYDTHSDAFEAEFHSLTVAGGYYGQNSAGAGIQFRGVRGRAIGCRVTDTPVGFELYKQFAGEATGYLLDGCSYRGTGTPIRCEHDGGLSGADARQTATVRDFLGVTSGLIGLLDLEAADVRLEGTVRCVQTGTQAGPRAVYCRGPSTVAGEVLDWDFSAATPSQEPRLIAYQQAGDGAPGLKAKVKAGSVDWFGIVASNTNPDPTLTAGAFDIECDADRAAVNASGTYSQYGSGSLPTAGSVRQRLTINGGGQVTTAKTTSFALTAWDRQRAYTCTSNLTLTVPAATVLGPEFDRCWIHAVGATVTIDGPGSTNVSLTTGQSARIYVRGAIVMVEVVASAANIDVST